MIYICVRTYGGGQWQNKIYPNVYKQLSSAKKKCEELNKIDKDLGEEWVSFPLYEEDN